jgi:predicted DNA-binding transcriptional regulator AlpA
MREDLDFFRELLRQPRRLLYVHEAAKFLGVTEPTFNRYRKNDPDFPKAIRIEVGADPKFDLQDLDAYVELLKKRQQELDAHEREKGPGIAEAVKRARAS